MRQFNKPVSLAILLALSTFKQRGGVTMAHEEEVCLAVVRANGGHTRYFV